MRPQAIFDELQNLAIALGYSVRREKGSFRGGGCRVHEKNVIVINMLMPMESRIIILARVLAGHDIAPLSIKPALRTILEREKKVMDTAREIIGSSEV
jgi:hypothetical protein